MTSITDPNGNVSSFTQTSGSETTVTVKNSGGQTALQYSVTFDPNGNQLSYVDANGRTVWANTYL